MRNYLIASDLSSRSAAALGRALAILAADLRAGIQARLTVLHVMDDAGPDRPELLDMLRAKLGDPPQADRIDCLCLAGDPDETILAVAAKLEAHLILMGVPRPRRFLQGLTGTTAERVLSESKCPLAVIRNPATGNRTKQDWNRILLASDKDDAAPQVVTGAEALGYLSGADVTVLHATNLPEPTRLRTGGLSSVDLQNLDMHAMAEREHRLRRQLHPHFATVRHLDFAMRHGAAAEAILDLQASNHFDLVIMGARGRGSLMRTILGSTSAEIIRRINTDLLCIPLAQG